MTTPNPYPGYYQASDGNWYPVAAQTPPAPPAPAAPPAPPEPVAARGTLDDWDDQPSAGGGSATSKFFTPVRVQTEHWLQLQIARDLNHNDVRQQRDKNNTLLTFKSTGKPKWELLVPTVLLGSSDPAGASVLTDGKVTVFLKGLSSDAFKAAMAAAGVADPGAALKKGKLAGASFYMQAKGTRQYGNNTANVFEFIYTPNGRENEAADAPPTAPPAAEPTASMSAAPSTPPPAPPTAPAAAPAAPPVASAPPPPAAAPAPPVAATPPPAPASAPPTAAGNPLPPPPAAAPAPPAPPADARKAALLQQLQGQTQ